MTELYHKYVFDEKKRKFVGKFEEMYQHEDKENYDSWHQEDMLDLGRQISLLMLNRFNFDSILDLGCGKGTFTHLLKKKNNKVIGCDISETTIKKARAKYRDVEFWVAPATEALGTQLTFNLIIMMEILSYLENWKEIIKKVSEKATYIYITLYLPPNPIGFIKSFDELRQEVQRYFNILEELMWNNNVIFLFGKIKS